MILHYSAIFLQKADIWDWAVEILRCSHNASVVRLPVHVISHNTKVDGEDYYYYVFQKENKPKIR